MGFFLFWHYHQSNSECHDLNRLLNEDKQKIYMTRDKVRARECDLLSIQHQNQKENEVFHNVDKLS